MRPFSDRAAYGEGWGVFSTGTQDATHNLFELQRIDMEGVFADDNEAIRFVVDSALGNPEGNAAAAIYFLHKESLNELDSIFRTAVGDEKMSILLNTLNLKI